eukprot:m.98620 g.98620  ORF g.98620 m.98620 type:complete len:92 (+) comp8865_c0_seq2:27-302(+)
MFGGSLLNACYMQLCEIRRAPDCAPSAFWVATKDKARIPVSCEREYMKESEEKNGSEGPFLRLENHRSEEIREASLLVVDFVRCGFRSLAL